jgi:primosomal protein N' (replication factor Y)
MSDLQVLEAIDMVVLSETEWIRDPMAKIQVMDEIIPILTQDQNNALFEVMRILNDVSQSRKTKPVLLHGVTGSGKTEIYLKAAEKVIASGRKVIILVPEISLTPQTVRRFINRFPSRVGLFHSRLTPGERYDTWRRVRAGKLDVIVGPRSALFIPFEEIGLIVVDECHDDSYSQGDYGIFYDLRVLAQHYANQINAACIFGSATPDVSQKFEAEENGWHVLNLPNRIQVKSRAIFKSQCEDPIDAGGVLPPVNIVDMREELKSGNTSILSIDLQESLKTTLEEGQQAILYLNRRGKATYIFCRNCGKALVCPRCDLTLTAHGEKNDLFCHQCGYKRSMPSSCPGCNSKAIRQLGVGTESVEAAVRKLLPSANILRWDAETSRFKDAHEIILSHFVNHRADILIGTQMISKGLDFPLVTLVGVILAETGLSLPDYRASERTFQLLAQVSGRAGRSDLGGKVIFQTYQPEHYVIGFAAGHDYDGFYSRELDYRRKFGYPPFYQLVRLEISSQSPAQAEKIACSIGQKCADWIEKGGIHTLEQIGPVPCYYGKVNNIYRWQVILRGADPVSLIKDHRKELTGVKIEVNPPNLL